MYDHYGPPRPYSYNRRWTPMHRPYGLSNFVGDVTLIGVTFGLWLIWILVRESSNDIRQYGLSNFVGDITLVGATCGLWLLWIILRELSRR